MFSQDQNDARRNAARARRLREQLQRPESGKLRSLEEGRDSLCNNDAKPKAIAE